MWIDFLRACQAGLVACSLFMLALLLIVSVCFALAPFARELWAKFRRADPVGRAVALLVVCIATAYGGAKSVDNVGADDGITLVDVLVEYDATHDVTAVEVHFIGNNVTVSTPVSVRDADTEAWRELEKIGATVTVDLSENILSFSVAGDVAGSRYWWVGSDTPAVIVETEGIEITFFHVSSTSVVIMWTCDDPNAVEFEIQRRHDAADQWQTVGVTSQHSYSYLGFTVGETWEWRVISTYEEVE